MNTRVPAEVFSPGEFLKDELDARNWTQVEFAEIIGKDTRSIYEIVNGKRSITPETAVMFAEALGSSAQMWMNLESQYQLSRVRPTSDAISRKAQLHGRFPIREMMKRGWVKATKEIDALEQGVLDFFKLPSIDSTPQFAHSAKKTSYEAISIHQLAWLIRCREIAKTLLVESYSAAKLRAILPQLHALTVAPEEVRHVPRMLAECGVRLVFVEALPGSKIDGACFWLDGKSPVVAMSLRHDRIDNFWFVLRHELEHVLQGDGKGEGCVDSDLDAGQTDQLPDEERVANEAAAEFCVPKKELDDFVARVAPFFSEQKVILFSRRISVHPGLVVGQLQRRINRYDLFKKHLVKVRAIAVSSGATDGWGLEYPLA
ncbi:MULTISPECIES: HigA family addiction module antitoxin [Burkholderia cepacia complex]|uniref:HigA family addiction module antitoxin n=1 Tax=Burkholderia cepacia complex TaxID=87882 RepID=UPI000F58F8C9|nr:MULTISPECIES: HigA family addiction module antitoxin [Burkholderia cepacia complex]QTO48379.1 HigA family addiction module antidote protein [Burkholderia latens]RQT47343.1 addiction module antidote protein, HigA family [Burkholderia cepacia]